MAIPSNADTNRLQGTQVQPKQRRGRTAMTIEAMKQALEALDAGPNAYLLMNTGGIANNLRQAIAEAEKQESVAVMQLHTDGWDLVEGIDTDWLETLPFGTTLYTHPQPKREPPTPREVKDTLRATGLLTNSQAWDVAEEVMKLLAAHGIKENT